MASAVRSIYVNAQPEQVWNYLQTPKNMVDWWPSCQEIANIQSNGDGGCTFEWVDKPGGVTCRGEIEEVVRKPGEGILLHLAGDICGEIRWRVRPDNGGSHVDYESDYDLPVRALIPYLSPIRLLMFHQHEADAIMKRLQEHFGENE